MGNITRLYPKSREDHLVEMAKALNNEIDFIAKLKPVTKDEVKEITDNLFCWTILLIMVSQEVLHIAL